MCSAGKKERERERGFPSTEEDYSSKLESKNTADINTVIIVNIFTIAKIILCVQI